jgi:hypothetical protein
MTPVWLMIGASVGSCVAVTALLGGQTGFAVMLGMLAPLAVTVGTWVAIERAHRRNPADVTGLMMAAFAGKMVFFGAYVVVVLRGLSVRPEPFVISFTAYFIGLYLVEALYLRRLFAGREDRRTP